jgi:hypothetical protein
VGACWPDFADGRPILVLFQPEKLVFFIALAQFDSSMKLP